MEYVLFRNSLGFFFLLHGLIFHTDSQLWNVRFLDPLFPLCIVHDHGFFKKQEKRKLHFENVS